MRFPNLKLVHRTLWWGCFLTAGLAGLWYFSQRFTPFAFDPFNVAWLTHRGDTMQQYVGWLFYRFENAGQPSGKFSGLLAPYGCSLCLNDSIPWAALTLGLFSEWLPHPFQYQSLVHAINYALGASFAFLMVYQITRSKLWALLSFPVVFLQPAMLFRGDHISLTSHWIILAALSLYLNRSQKRQRLWCLWMPLIAVSALTHVYLTTFCFAIFFAFILRETFFSMRSSARQIVGFTVCSLIIAPSMWIVSGCFSDVNYSAGGAIYYSMNLLAPINPANFSRFLPPLPLSSEQNLFEGFNYAGFGALCLFTLALILIVIDKVWRRGGVRRGKIPGMGFHGFWKPLVVILAILALYALNQWYFWGHDMVFHWPRFPQTPFRASGRFFWPVHYAMLAMAISCCFTLFRPRWMMVPILLAASLLQGWDTWHEATSRYHRTYYQRSPIHHLVSEEWNSIFAKYRHYTFFPGFGNGILREWEFGEWVSRILPSGGRSLNIGECSRKPSGDDMEKTNEHNFLRIMQGGIKSDEILILNHEEWIRHQDQLQSILDCHILDGYPLCLPLGSAHSSFSKHSAL